MRHTTDMRTIAIGLLLASAAFAKDAKIIIVERSDTKELKAAYADYKAAQAKWEKVKTEVAKKYTVWGADGMSCLKDTCGKVMDGWDKVEFSVDFRALVPQRSYISSISGWNYPVNTFTNTSGGGGTIGSVSSGSTSSANMAWPSGDLTVSSDSVRSDLTTRESAK